ncbi:MAG: GreA/GreB family elongation factor [Trueperaceae bacterium]|nr:GreA/GreB family elongation factor [Trueperaceae bacterium]
MVRLTTEGRDRLERELGHARKRLSDVDAFLREQMACTCDTDAITLRDARLEKARLTDRVDRLEETLDDAHVLPPGRTSSTVEVGAVVTVAEVNAEVNAEVDADEETTLQVVETLDAAIVADDVMRISDASPLGRRLLGLRVGDSVRVPLGERTVTYEVRSLRY